MTDTSEKAKTQKQAILAHLKQYGQIDMLTAWREYGCAALRSRISDLRKEGIEIESRMTAFKSKFGHNGRFAIYFMKFSPSK